MASKINTSTDCPHCHRRLIQFGHNGRAKIRTSLLELKKGGDSVSVVCRHCHRDVELDMHLGEKLLKALYPLRSMVRKRVILPR